MSSVAIAAGIEDVDLVKKLKETNPKARIIYK